jgi:GT2 family glycosyltransferase
MESKDLSIVIVTFKSEEKIFNCLNSIPHNIQVTIVENSDNKSFKRDIEGRYKNVKCILAGDNKGYAVANNIGLNEVKTKFALILNPDTILDINAINNFFATANKFKDFWLIGPANDQQIKNDHTDDNISEVKSLKGFAIFINIKKFEKKYFDENFFLYFEEIDLCNRVIINKGKIYLDKNIIIKHEGANSVKKTDQAELEKNRNWHWMWSTFYFHKKYKGFFVALFIIFPKLISSITKFLFYFLIFKKEKRDIYFFRLSGILNSIIGKKSWYRPSLD